LLSNLSRCATNRVVGDQQNGHSNFAVSQFNCAQEEHYRHLQFKIILGKQLRNTFEILLRKLSRNTFEILPLKQSRNTFEILLRKNSSYVEDT
jgi:hypothetical protein